VATTQEALQITTVVPSFTVDDLQKSIRFYEATRAAAYASSTAVRGRR
jgi:hypothetical protein